MLLLSNTIVKKNIISSVKLPCRCISFSHFQALFERQNKLLQTCRRCISIQLKDHAILALQGHLGIDFEYVTSVGKVVMHISPAAVLLCYSSSLTLTVEGMIFLPLDIYPSLSSSEAYRPCRQLQFVHSFSLYTY